MAHVLTSLELRFSGSDFGLSARRLWEHTELGQINPFNRAISERSELNDAASFIDVVRFDGETYTLAGLSLAEFLLNQFPRNCCLNSNSDLKSRVKTIASRMFVGRVAAHLDHCANRKAVRNQHHEFLPTAGVDEHFGVPHIFSTLQRKLQTMGKSKANAEQWLKTIENFKKNGLRAEELEGTELLPELDGLDEDSHQFTAAALVDLCSFKDFRISVIAVVADAQRQVRFGMAPDKKLQRTKKVLKGQRGQTRNVAGFDPVLGYRIEEVAHQTLWGAESHWQAVTHEGQIIGNGTNQTLFSLKEDAIALAASDAKQKFPKRVALGRFGNYAWTGGESYREWLVTLPYCPISYMSGHFNVRNVLAHIRCDIREGADGERVLMLQEVQSDWAQRARRAVISGEGDHADEVPPPFMKEWPALVMKLVLLHAAHQAFDAVAWTRGAHQVSRYKGLGAVGLIELYDRTLPREVNRMVKRFGAKCETLGAYVPTNFSIRQTEDGYEVYSPEGVRLGTALSQEDARQFVPDQGHELLTDVHGVRLSRRICQAILDIGFPAWG